MVCFEKVTVMLGLLLVLTLCPKAESSSMSKADFPKDIIWGTAIAAFQAEGAVAEDCRGPSMWDTYTKKFPHRCENSNATVAVDFYHRYKEDIKLMKDLNTNGFRFSISWTRIFPHGRMSKGVCKKGVKFYHDLIDELLNNNITPLVTVFHWDTPQDLEDEYMGFLSEDIVKDFTEYANFTFHEYGDKVKNWITFNEPWVFSRAGYDIGKKAPGRCSPYIDTYGPLCEDGRSGFEAYQVTHHLLLSHAEAVDAFRKCKKCAGGKIGIAHSPAWFEPEDLDSMGVPMERVLDFILGWHLAPTTYGDYPQSMKDHVGYRLPKFTEAQKAKLKNSADFVGINYYTAHFGKNNETSDLKTPSWGGDSQVDWESKNAHDYNIGSKPNGTNMHVYSKGLAQVLKYVKEVYGDPEIMITENGYGEQLGEHDNVNVGTKDFNRMYYLQRHILSLHEAIYEYKVNVTGYFVWSLMDLFEWQDGYKSRFGLYYVDFNKNLIRTIKKSGSWYSDFLKPEIPSSKIVMDEL